MPPKRSAALCQQGRHTIVDLFAGPGGWSEGLRQLGYGEVGIEWDAAACATAQAAGHVRVQKDVAELSPQDFAPAWGLIASPPCQAWSMAGKGGGRRDRDLCVMAALELSVGTDTRSAIRGECEDPRSLLVVEPLRWALALRPEWIAMEQVPPVLEMWTLFAQVLAAEGYATWAGVLEAERYGVPQTRERAILMASRVGPVHPPLATHQRYVKGEPQRHDVTLEGEILPWVSMAQALGWSEGNSPRPAPTVTSGGTAQGGVEVFASAASREAVRQALAPVDYDQRQTGAVPRPIAEPAPTMLAEGLKKGVPQWRFRADNQANACIRDADEPAPTMRFGHSCNQSGWIPADQDGDVRYIGVRVTVEQAAILQSFRPDYPWQGTRTKQFEQVGNAVPPQLAQAVLGALIPAVTEDEVAA